MKTHLLIICLLAFCGCSSFNEYEKEAWNVAYRHQANRSELVGFLSYYKELGSAEKYEAACFLVKNMPTKYGITSKGWHAYDIDMVKADSLKASLEYSFRIKAESPFLRDYTLEQFYEYILPYRISNEPLEYYWKWDLASRLEKVGFTDIIEAAKAINLQIRFDVVSDSYGDLPQSYSQLIENNWGKCDDRTRLVVMALRAVGIPAAYEFVPYWGSGNNGHSFATVILPDGNIYPLPDTNEAEVDEYLSRKVPKIYRQMYAAQAKNEVEEKNVPDLFRNKDIMDVTSLHPIGVREIRISNVNNAPVYLSVFSPNGWMPVVESATGNFEEMGTGTKANGTMTAEAKDLGDGILYMPTHWKNGLPQSAGFPLIASNREIRTIRPDMTSTETIVLRRKFPLHSRIIDYAKLMISGEFEGANRPDFSDAETLYRIMDIPESKMQYIKVNAGKPYRYIRYKRLKGTFSIAEMDMIGKDGKRLSFHPMACEALQEEKEIENVFDGDPLTYFQTAGNLELWIGCDLKRPTYITAIGFAPRNDDNAVSPNNTYELFFWDKGWKSLGKRVSEADSLVYENVPKESLLWLRNLSRGKEERPFTYEDSRQIWW